MGKFLKKVKKCEKIGNVGAKIVWKAVMERPAGAELRIRRQANKTGERDARESLTRRRGDAEEVREGLKFLCDLCVLCGLKTVLRKEQSDQRERVLAGARQRGLTPPPSGAASRRTPDYRNIFLVKVLCKG